MWSYHKYLIRFKEKKKKSLAASSPGMLITITNTNHKLTTSIKATKAPNIQIRLLVEESQQLNSKKWKTRKKAKFLANEMILISNYAQKDKRKNAIKWNKRRRAIRNCWIFFLTIYHSCSFVTLLFQQRCQVKWPPWSLEDLPIKKGRKSNTLLHKNTRFGDPKAWLQLPVHVLKYKTHPMRWHDTCTSWC